jgi:hypothetical protein
MGEVCLSILDKKELASNLDTSNWNPHMSNLDT